MMGYGEHLVRSIRLTAIKLTDGTQMCNPVARMEPLAAKSGGYGTIRDTARTRITPGGLHPGYNTGIQRHDA